MQLEFGRLQTTKRFCNLLFLVDRIRTNPQVLAIHGGHHLATAPNGSHSAQYHGKRQTAWRSRLLFATGHCLTNTCHAICYIGLFFVMLARWNDFIVHSGVDAAPRHTMKRGGTRAAISSKSII